ncbi:MAG: topoisomerase [Aquificae bacterium]|nr:topoisomerase [Aquificota bacterium]
MKFKSFSHWKEKLQEYGNTDNIYILVEGKKDESVLKNWHIKNVISLKGKRFYDVVEEMELVNLCIILVDIDKQGEKIFQKIRFLLEREGIPTDISFREYLKNFSIKEIEELPLLEAGGIH